MFVISKKTDKDWDDLSLNFRNSPYITLDQDMLSVDIFEDDISAAYYTVFIFSLVIHIRQYQSFQGTHILTTKHQKIFIFRPEVPCRLLCYGLNGRRMMFAVLRVFLSQYTTITL